MANYVFQRTYVDESNKGFLKGQEAPENFSEEKIQRLVASGLLLKVESVAEFLEEGVENEDVEKLDPERKPKGKKV